MVSRGKKEVLCLWKLCVERKIVSFLHQDESVRASERHELRNLSDHINV
jgi:hypothetical protein